MSGLSYITTCSICGQKFTHSGFKDMMADNLPQAVKVFDAFKQHIETKHPKEDMRAQLAAQALLGLLRIQNFTSQDEAAMKLRDYQRFQLSEMLRKNRVPDAKIVEQVTALELPDEYVQRVISCVRLMRDILEERGKFQPQGPDQENPASKSGKPQLVV